MLTPHTTFNTVNERSGLLWCSMQLTHSHMSRGTLHCSHAHMVTWSQYDVQMVFKVMEAIDGRVDMRKFIRSRQRQVRWCPRLRACGRA
jgi:hypothetical protein